MRMTGICYCISFEIDSGRPVQTVATVPYEEYEIIYLDTGEVGYIGSLDRFKKYQRNLRYGEYEDLEEFFVKKRERDNERLVNDFIGDVGLDRNH